MDTLLSALKAYFDLGFEAFLYCLRVINGEKKLSPPNGWNTTHFTYDMGEAMLAADPSLNAIAIKTGSCSNLLVLDCDRKNGLNGIESLQKLGIVIPEDTPTVKSLNDGVHYYFRSPEETILRGTRSFSKYGFDIRGEGGIITAPPTIIAGVGGYEPIAPMLSETLRHLPEKFIQFLLSHRGPTSLSPAVQIQSGYRSFLDLNPKQQQTLTKLREALSTAINGTRSEKDFAFIAKCISFGVSKEAIRDACQNAGKFLEEAQRGRFEDYFERTYTNAYQSTLKIQVSITDDSLDLIDGYPATDGGRADRSLQAHKNIMIPVTGEVWLVYNGKYWEANQNLIYRLAHAIALDLRDKAKNLDDSGDKETAEKLRKEAKSFDTVKTIKSMLEIAIRAYERPYELDSFDSNIDLLNVKNGTIDLRTGKLTPHDFADMISKMIELDFDPTAACPKFFAFLEQIMPSKEMRDFLQCLFGYTATGHTGERCIFVFNGNGRNGKSTLVEIISRILGTYAGKGRKETLMPKKAGAIPNDVAALRGLRLVHTSELNENDMLDESFVKEITGGDSLQARFLNKEFFQFTPRFKILVLTNHKPKIPSGDSALWDRIVLVPFEKQFSEEEKRPFEIVQGEFLAEAQGILAWIVEGARRWYADGRLILPETIKSATKIYKEDEDIILQFLTESCRTDNPEAEEALAYLYDSFTRFCTSNGIKFPLSRKQFSKRLEEKGFPKVRKSSGQVFKGIKYKFSFDPQTEAPLFQ